MAHERSDSYLKDSISIFQYYKKLGENAIAQCPDDGLLALLDDQSNSIATIVKHLWGNMLSRWTDFLTTDGEKPTRDRDAEFDNDIKSKEELTAKWNEAWDCFFKTFNTLTEDDLNKIVY